MKLTGLFFIVMAMLALFVGTGQANPKVNLKALKKGGKVIRKGLGVIGAAGTAHEIYSQVRHRRQ